MNEADVTALQFRTSSVRVRTHHGTVVPETPAYDRAEQASLVRAAVAGDAEAFETLIEPLQRPLYGYALRLCGNVHLAEDLSQDTFIKAYRSLSSFSGQSRLSTWLHRILRNTWIDHIKSSKRQALDLREADQDPDMMLEEPSHMTAEAVVRFSEMSRQAEMQDRLSEALQHLPPKLREVLVLRDIEGCSYDEMADLIDVAVGTIKSRLARARDRLRSQLV